jgi:hypothetical protein
MADLGQPIASTSEERQIAIRLSTKDAAYTIPPAKFLVPASWRRYQLSELINKVLENGQSKPTFPRSLPLSSFSPPVLPLLFDHRHHSQRNGRMTSIFTWHWYSSYSSIRGISHAMSNQNYIISSLPDALFFTPSNNSKKTKKVSLFRYQHNWHFLFVGDVIDSPIPFDFLIDQTLLRTSLGSYCAQTNTSEEIVLDVEFLPSTLPPQLDSTVPAEDWVSDVDVNVPGCVPPRNYLFSRVCCNRNLPFLCLLLCPLWFPLHPVELSCQLRTLELYRYNNSNLVRRILKLFPVTIYQFFQLVTFTNQFLESTSLKNSSLVVEWIESLEFGNMRLAFFFNSSGVRNTAN